uniref:Solute-binding protein family 5 domain-containing protein n=1 Tax=Pseudo-nitzschia australis TaxID=44445 RepID=A0A7S4EEL3_9STRA
MLSPAAFSKGNTTDPITHNSCHVGWGTIGSAESPDDVVCAGITQISGTGPFVFKSRSTETKDDEEIDTEVIFTGNSDYWGGAPAIETLKIIRYENSEGAKAALLGGSLDVIWGSGVLSDKDIAEVQDNDKYQGQIQVFHSKDIQNVILLLNSGKPPLNDINLRKTIIHAIDKAAIVEEELAGLQKVVDNVFPLDAPNCEVDLTPRWDYDPEKASLLFCDREEIKKSSSLSIGLGIGLGGLCLVALVVAVNANNKRKNVEAELDLLRKNANAQEA